MFTSLISVELILVLDVWAQLYFFQMIIHGVKCHLSSNPSSTLLKCYLYHVLNFPVPLDLFLDFLFSFNTMICKQYRAGRIYSTLKLKKHGMVLHNYSKLSDTKTINISPHLTC